MDAWEIPAVALSLTCVVLTVRRNIWCWPVGMVAVIFYAYVFFGEKLYADAVLQAVYFAQGIYGWAMWARKGGTERKVSVVRVEMFDVLMHSVLAVPSWLLISIIMTTHTDNPIPAVDAGLAVASLIANYYLAKRILESWILWMVVDVGYVLVFIYRDLYLSSGLYFVFLILAVYGFMGWKKALKNTRKASY